jgi:hypothetical protein
MLAALWASQFAQEGLYFVVAIRARRRRFSALECPGILFSKVVRQDLVTDYDITKEYSAFDASWHPSTNANNQGKPDAWKAPTAAHCDTCCLDLSHASHVRQHDIMVADHACSIGIHIVRSFAVSITICIPYVVEKELHGVRFYL